MIIGRGRQPVRQKSGTRLRRWKLAAASAVRARRSHAVRARGIAVRDLPDFAHSFELTDIEAVQAHQVGGHRALRQPMSALGSLPLQADVPRLSEPNAITVCSAVQLQRQLGISYETAWALLHKLRRAMVKPEREALKDKVEVDETYLGGHEAGLKGGRQLLEKALILLIWRPVVPLRQFVSGPCGK